MRNGRGHLIWAVAALPVIWFASPVRAGAQEGPAGTYRVWLCEAPCSVADSAQAIREAVVVIVEELTVTDSSNRPPLLRWIRPRGTQPNACFRVLARRGGDVYFGIVERGSTVWRIGEDGVRALDVYRSPDAAYQIRWEGTGPMSAGEGWSFGPATGIGWERNGFFAAVRTGPPDVTGCG